MPFDHSNMNEKLLQINVWFSLSAVCVVKRIPDSKVQGANMGPIWGRQVPGGPHVGPVNFAIWVTLPHALCPVHIHGFMLRFLTDRQIRKSIRILHDLVTFTITLGVATVYNGINTIY